MCLVTQKSQQNLKMMELEYKQAEFEFEAKIVKLLEH